MRGLQQLWRACALLIALPAVAAASEAIGVEEAVAGALHRNATLLRLESEVSAERARLSGASIPLSTNPELQVYAGPRWRDSQRSTDYGVGLSQRLEIFGQRGLRVEATRSALRSAQARLAAGRIEIAAEVRKTFYSALAAGELFSIATEAEKLAGNALAAARTRSESGAASGIEVNAARIALGRAVRERADAQNRQVVAVSRLLLLLGSDASESIRLKGKLSNAAPVPEDLRETVDRALARRSDLQAARGDLEAARSEARLAGRDVLPSPRVGISYGQEEGAKLARGTLGVELPLFQRNQAIRGVAAARVEQAERAVEAVERSVRSEVIVAAARLRAANAAAAAFGGEALTAVNENLELLGEAYRAGKVDFFQLLVLNREALDARASYLNVLVELADAQAELTRATGSLE